MLEVASADQAAEALVELVRPLVDALRGEARLDVAGCEAALALGCLAWNAAPQGLGTGAEVLRRYRRTLPAPSADDAAKTARVLDLLLARRRTLFAEDRRLLTEVRLRKVPAGRLAVTAAFA